MLGVKHDFPLLARLIDGEPIVYLDSAATSLKPQVVIDAVTEVFTRCTSNVHRALHELAREATEKFEGAREDVSTLIGAEPRELIITRGTSDAINLVRLAGRRYQRTITTVLEHHSNFLPWAFGEGASVIGVTERGDLDLEALEKALQQGADLVTAAVVSNVHGAINPVNDLVRLGHQYGARVLLDASQAVGHLPIDVKALDVDFLAFSSHKMLGPSGVGGLYAKREAMAELTPVVFGGSMVESVHLDGFTLEEPPACFEPGTPAIEGVVGWGAAARYLKSVGVKNIEAHCGELVEYGFKRLREIPAVSLVGPANAERVSATLSFNVVGMEAHGVARILSDRYNIFVRSGFHCAQPMHEALQLRPTVRASLHVYNSREDIDALCDALRAVTRFVS